MSSLNLAVAAVGLAFGQKPNSSVLDHEKQLRAWVEQARTTHPEAVSAREMASAGRLEEQGTRAWMPPTSQFQYQSDGQIQLSVSQMIPGPGKLDAEGAVRSIRTQMGGLDSAERIRKLSLSVREAAWMEWMAWQKLTISVEQESLWVQLSNALRRTQAQGMTNASEIWLVVAKASQAKADVEKTRAEAMSATAMRESWTGPVEMRLEVGPIDAPDWDSSALAQASQNRSDVGSMEKDAAMQAAMGQAMNKSLRPDFMVGAMVMQMNTGMPGWGVMAGMTLPFVPWAQGMAKSGAAGALARSRSLESRTQSMRRMARSEVQDHLARAKAAWMGWHELDSLVLPGQQRAATDVRTRYSQGREMLSMIFTMEDMVRMTRMQAIMLRGEYELERVRLFAAAGIEPRTQDGAK